MSEKYDIAEIYAEMEKEIISSMQRNLSGHIEEEKRVGFDYPQWQAEKLKSLRRYQIENAKIIHSYTDGLPLKVKAILQDELKQGVLNELKKYKAALAAGYESSVIMKDSFFRINARKVNSLIKSIDNDLAKANQACLRYVNDAYRQVIFKSEMFVSNGVYTEKKAVEKAIEEFEKRGLHCIEYANGSYHDIADYADMAVKTASQRAQLMGEGEFRKKIGNSLIKISKHGGTCPLCAKWEGRVLIDDVYSGGTPKDGNYPLLSEAMVAGLYHPRCRHGAGTYYPEVDDIWNDDYIRQSNNEFSKEELKNIVSDDIIKNTVDKEVKDVHYIGKLDKSIYQCVTDDIITDEVVITEKQIEHIKLRHPNDYERFSQYFKEIVGSPDYIIEANKPNSALILKEIQTNEEQFKAVVRIATSSDNQSYKNSIITFMKIDDKEWKRLINNKKILYKFE